MTRRAYQLLQADTVPGSATAKVPHLDVDPSVFTWVNPNDNPADHPNTISDFNPNAPFLAFKPASGPTRYLAYVFEDIAHYTDGSVDTDLVPSQIAKPDPSRGPVAYYLNGVPVYVSEVSQGVAPAPRVQALLRNGQ